MHPVNVDDIDRDALPEYTQSVLTVIEEAAHRYHKVALTYEPLGHSERGKEVRDRETGEPFREGLREFTPYSLRVSRSGHLFLLGKNGNNGVRAYRLSQIVQAIETADAFEDPEGWVEL